MRAATLQRRALENQRRALDNKAILDEQTNRDNQAAAIDAVATPIIESQRKDAFPVYDALANAVRSQSRSARGPGGTTPVAQPKLPNKVARSSVPKTKGKR